MKFLFFSDFHHSSSGRSPFGEMDQLEAILDAAEKNNVDFIIHGGDFTSPGRAPEFVAKYNDFHIPTYHCLGNHDTDTTPLAEVLKHYKMQDGHYFFDKDGYRIIVTDPNYSKIDDEYVHFDMGNYFKTPESRDWMPPSQIEWLKETIESAPHPCIIISHSSYERADGIHNKDDVRRVIDDANKKRKNAVLMAINGHYHVDYTRLLEGVLYFDFNCVNNYWLPKTHDLFPKEITEKYRSAEHCVYWNDPLYAIITIEGTTITCEGRESEFFMGISRETALGSPYDRVGRAVTPKVSSFKITL